MNSSFLIKIFQKQICVILNKHCLEELRKMAKGRKSVKKEMDYKEFFEALKLMEEERGIPQKFIAEKIETFNKKK